MIVGQLMTCEECRDGSCAACLRYKRRQRAKVRAQAAYKAREDARLSKSSKMNLDT